MRKFLISATAGFGLILIAAFVAHASLPAFQLNCKKCKKFASIECEHQLCWGCINSSAGYDVCDATDPAPSCPECPTLCSQTGECP